MKIAFIGAGRMGAAMIRNLLRNGHSVTVFNRTPAKAEELKADGAQVAASIAEALEGAEICWTMLPDDKALEQVALGEGDGIVANLPANAVHVSSSTISVAMSRRLAEAHSASQQAYLGLPVFGRPEAAAQAKLIAITGGDAATIERCTPAIQSVSRLILNAGPHPWQANLFKLCGNFTLGAMLETMSEASAALQKAGMDHRQFFEFLNELYASPVYKNYGSMVVDRKFDPAGFQLKLGLKDVRQMVEAADELASPMPLASLVRDQFLAAMSHGQQDLDMSSIALVSERNAGLPDKKS